MADNAKPYAPEIALAKFLETMEVQVDSQAYDCAVMVCTTCEQPVCAVEDGDTLRVLFTTALTHADCGD